jgi:competence protein ComEC
VTAPLVVFYFHQLPLYSIVTNLVAIPLLSLLILFFVLSIPCMAIGMHTMIFNWLMLKISYLLNLTMEVVASIPGSVIANLSLSGLNLTLLMTLLLVVMMLPGDRIHLSGYLFVILFSVLLFSTSRNRFNTLHSSELVVAHFNGGSLVTFREGIHVDHYLLAGKPDTEKQMEKYVDLVWNKYRYRSRYMQAGEHPNSQGFVSRCCTIGKGIWMLGNNNLRGCVISGALNEGNLDVLAGWPINFILLSDEPDLGKLTERAGLDIIIDGSNRDWYAGKAELKYNKIYLTGKRGAYRLRW